MLDSRALVPHFDVGITLWWTVYQFHDYRSALQLGTEVLTVPIGSHSLDESSSLTFSNPFQFQIVCFGICFTPHREDGSPNCIVVDKSDEVPSSRYRWRLNGTTIICMYKTNRYRSTARSEGLHFSIGDLCVLPNTQAEHFGPPASESWDTTPTTLSLSVCSTPLSFTWEGF